MTAFILPAGFGKRPRKPGTKRAHPEQSLQTNIAQYLRWALYPGTFFTAIGHGGGGRMRGAILKGMGMRSGVPDLMLIHNFRAHFLEVKAKAGALSPEQKIVHTEIIAAGGTVAVCRSLAETIDRLTELGIPLRTEKPSTTRLREAGLRLGDGHQQ